MYPEDRVLVGVIRRKRDFAAARDDHWYRIPQARLPRGVNTEYIALFLSGILKGKPSGIYYFAEPQGIELAYRKDLLPSEAGHARADEVYYRVSLSPLREKTPPILNSTRRPITFIYTTWDRFVRANEIRDLYSEADYYVDRIYHALRQRNVYAEREWDAARGKTGIAAGVRVLCEDGVINAATEPGSDVFLDSSQPDDAILQQILDQIARRGGMVTMHLPHDIS